MSENGINGPPQTSELFKGGGMPVIKPMAQYTFNGRTSSQNSSRSSSPPVHMSNIPASQLPPARSIPSSQLPPSMSLNSVTHKVSQLSVQNKLLSNVNGPQFTSTPNETSDYQKKNVNLVSGDCSPITSKTEDKNSSVQTDFQEVPLHQDKSVSNLANFGGTDHMNSQLKKVNDNVNSNDLSSQNQAMKFNNQLFDKNQIGQFGVRYDASNFHPVVNNVGNAVTNNQQGFSRPNIGIQQGQNAGITNNPGSGQHPMSGQGVQNVQSPFFSQPQATMPNVSYSSGQSYNSNVYPTSTISQPNVPPVINTRMPSNLGLSQRPSFPNMPPQKQPLLGNAQIQSRMPPQAIPRPNFNLNVMGNQPRPSPPVMPSMSQPGVIPPINQPGIIPSMTQPGVTPPPQGFPPSPRIPQQRMLSADTSVLNTSRYPPLPAQRVSSQPNIHQGYRNQPQVGYTQPGFNQYPAQSVVNQGFNKLWGAENFDLLQTVNILPPDKIVPPPILLGNESLNAANCSGDIFRSTITKIPETQSLLQKSRLPLGILIHPFKDLIQLSVIQCNVIVRCRACRTYINPFVFFVDSKRWKCNLCYRVNDLPEEFQFDPVSKTYGDPSRRPEIKSSTIEYIAPAEYMLRPPQPAVYLFLLDVSRLAVESGYLSLFSKVLLEELENLPGDSRTQIGFITYDSCLHFFSFADGLIQPHEMIVLDVDDVFLPCPDNLLVNLKDRKELIKDLLNQLPARYSNSYDSSSALGAALQAAHRLMTPTGGRVTVFQASLPNVGPGALTPREDPNQRSSTEVHNLKPANDFYKRLALDCSSQQIAVDLFLVNSQYVDIATVSGISRFSGGCIHHFPLFKMGRPILTEQLERSFRRYITRKIGFEAVMRIRCTRGMSIHTFHGNFFVRSTDLLSLPNVNPDAGFGMQVSIEENLSDVETVCFQAALLYTSSKGERRIRVHTLCLPVVSTLHEVINSADQQCIVGLLAKMAVDRSVESSLSDAREAFINVAIDILSSYKLSLNLGAMPNGLLAPNCLKLLPLFISALLKNQAFRTGTSTRLDDRVKTMIDMKTKPLPLLMQNIYPDLYPIHNLEEQQVLLNAEEEPVHVPPRIQLTSRLVDNTGAYLMDTGEHMMLYVSSGVSQLFLNEALGVPNYNSLNDQTYEIPLLGNQTSQRLVTFIHYLNQEKPYAATLQIIKDNSPNRSVFLERLVEDRVENALSYHEFLQHVKAQVK